MAINDDDITTSAGGGEGPADGGSILKATTAARTAPQAARVPPTVAQILKAMTAAPTPPLGARVPPTVARILKATTAAPTAPRDRCSMLSRCIATDPQTFRARTLGGVPLLSRSDALPRDFSDLLSARTVDELLAERGYAHRSSAWPRRAKSSPGSVTSDLRGSARRCPTRWIRRRCSPNSPRAQR